MYQSKIASPMVDELYDALLTLKDREAFYQFFDDLCTIGEIQSMAQRLTVAKKLRSGETFAQISEQTGVSSATITRVNKCLGYGSGGYDLVLAKK